MDRYRNNYIFRMAAKTKRKGRRNPMRFTYARTPKEHFRYTLKTDPPDAMYWTTYRLKKTDVVLLDKLDKATTALVKQEVSQRREARKPQYVETRKTKQKTRRQNKS